MKPPLIGVSDLESTRDELKEEKDFIKLLKNKINEVYFNSKNFGDEDGPTIEELI